MSKDPTPKADGLREMREKTRGHLQAKAGPVVIEPSCKTTISIGAATAKPPAKKVKKR